jgi:hypothetical protein
MSSLSMSRAEREAFLAGTHVAILGPQMGAAYMKATYPTGLSDQVIVRLRPQRWSTADFRKFGLG